MSPMTTSLANDCTTVLNAAPTITATARSTTFPRMMNFLKSLRKFRTTPPSPRSDRGTLTGVLRPVFRVDLGVLAEDASVDRVELDQTARTGRLVRAVDEDAP